MTEYFTTIGGRPEKPGKSTKKRKSVGATTTPDRTPAKKPKKQTSTKAARYPLDSSKKSIALEESRNGTPDVTKKPAKTGTPDAEVSNWLPKSSQWDAEVEKVDTVTKEDNDTLWALLLWKNGRRTRVSLQQCYQKCPQKVSIPIDWTVTGSRSLNFTRQMLRFYERHLYANPISSNPLPFKLTFCFAVSLEMRLRTRVNNDKNNSSSLRLKLLRQPVLARYTLQLSRARDF